MFKSLKTVLLGLFLISPIVLLILYTVNTARNEAPKPNVNVANLKLVTPVAIIDEITQKIREDDLEDAITKIRNEMPDANIPSSKGTPLIVLAAEKDYTDIVGELIQKGADPDKADLNTSETALIKAVRNQNFDTISILLNAGANLNLGTNQGLTPLSLAIDLHNEALATHLLSSGATNGISKENLFSYIFKKNPIGVSLMLAGGVSPSVTDKDNNTPLIISAANGDLESTKLLISYRANVNAKNKDGMTPLLYAVKGKYWDVAEYLINSGARINSTNVYGQNALFWAAYHGNADLVHDLLMGGANYTQKTRRGQTALQMARAYNHKEAAKMLEDYIAYKNLPRDEKGNIIQPKVKQQDTAQVSSLQNTDYEGIDMTADIENQIKQSQSTAQQTVTQEQPQQVPAQTQQNKLQSSNQTVQQSAQQSVQQPTRTQVSTLQSTSNQAEMPQMPGGMDMSAIMSMAGSQGAQGGNMGDMMKQLQNMGAAAQSGSKTQQQGMPENVQIPADMNMNDISKMIPAGALPEGVDLNNLASMNPEQLKKMGIPEDQIANITQIQKQMGQSQNPSAAGNGFKPKDLNSTTNSTYANGIPKTQINKLQTSGN